MYRFFYNSNPGACDAKASRGIQFSLKLMV